MGTPLVGFGVLDKENEHAVGSLAGHSGKAEARVTASVLKRTLDEEGRRVRPRLTENGGDGGGNRRRSSIRRRVSFAAQPLIKLFDKDSDILNEDIVPRGEQDTGARGNGVDDGGLTESLPSLAALALGDIHGRESFGDITERLPSLSALAVDFSTTQVSVSSMERSRNEEDAGITMALPTLSDYATGMASADEAYTIEPEPNGDLYHTQADLDDPHVLVELLHSRDQQRSRVAEGAQRLDRRFSDVTASLPLLSELANGLNGPNMGVESPQITMALPSLSSLAEVPIAEERAPESVTALAHSAVNLVDDARRRDSNITLALPSLFHIASAGIADDVESPPSAGEAEKVENIQPTIESEEAERRLSEGKGSGEAPDEAVDAHAASSSPPNLESALGDNVMTSEMPERVTFSEFLQAAQIDFEEDLSRDCNDMSMEAADTASLSQTDYLTIVCSLLPEISTYEFGCSQLAETSEQKQRGISQLREFFEENNPSAFFACNPFQPDNGSATQLQAFKRKCHAEASRQWFEWRNKLEKHTNDKLVEQVSNLEEDMASLDRTIERIQGERASVSRHMEQFSKGENALALESARIEVANLEAELEELQQCSVVEDKARQNEILPGENSSDAASTEKAQKSVREKQELREKTRSIELYSVISGILNWSILPGMYLEDLTRMRILKGSYALSLEHSGETSIISYQCVDRYIGPSTGAILSYFGISTEPQKMTSLSMPHLLQSVDFNLCRAHALRIDIDYVAQVPFVTGVQCVHDENGLQLCISFSNVMLRVKGTINLAINSSYPFQDFSSRSVHISGGNLSAETLGLVVDSVEVGYNHVSRTCTSIARALLKA